MKMKSLVLSLAIAGFAGGAFAATTTTSNLVTNGDFESQSFAGWNLVGTVNWNLFFNNNDGHGVIWASGDAGSYGVLSQPLSTIVGKNYTVSFDLRSNTSSNEFLVTFGNTDVFHQKNFIQPWISYSFSGLIASSESTLLKISSRNDAFFNYIDNIRVAETVSPVPEPETYAMLLAGLGLIGAAVRRRQRSVEH